MNPDEQLRRILRVKRYEQPGDEFSDAFLQGLQRKIQSDGLRLGLGARLKEAWSLRMSQLRWPLALGGLAAACGLLVLGLSLAGHPPGAQPRAVAAPLPSTAGATAVPTATAESVLVSDTTLPETKVPKGKARTTEQRRDDTAPVTK